MEEPIEDIYAVPLPYTRYKCSFRQNSKEFTILMKWVMLVRKHPELLQKIEEVCQTNPELINKTNKRGWTALMLAAANSHSDSTEEVVKLLLQYGADPNIQNNYGMTALMMVASPFNSDSTLYTIQLLLENGANPNLQDTDGWTALIFAMNHYEPDHVEDIVQLLLQKGANPNLRTNDGYSVIMSRCTENLFSLLIQYGATVDYRILRTCLNTSQHNIKKLINIADNISDAQFRELLTFNKHHDLLKNMIPYINFTYDEKTSIDEQFYFEKFQRKELRKKYSQALVDINHARNEMFYKDTSFGGWLTVKKLEMAAKNQTYSSLLETLLASNDDRDKKYMSMFCIHNIARLKELMEYY